MLLMINVFCEAEAIAATFTKVQVLQRNRA